MHLARGGSCDFVRSAHVITVANDTGGLRCSYGGATGTGGCRSPAHTTRSGEHRPRPGRAGGRLGRAGLFRRMLVVSKETVCACPETALASPAAQCERVDAEVQLACCNRTRGHSRTSRTRTCTSSPSLCSLKSTPLQSCRTESAPVREGAARALRV